jgi:ankyrin repeat protein
MNHKEITTIYKIIDNNQISQLKTILSQKDYSFKPEEIRDIVNYSISKNNIEILKMLFDMDLEILNINKQSISLLQSACSVNKIDVVKFLFSLSINLDINYKSKKNKSALSYAIIAKNKELVQLLLNKGANPNDIDFDEKSMLVLAIQKEQIDIIKLLLDFGANINYQDKSKMTALHFSVAKRNKEIFLLLLEHGAQNLVNHLNYTALDFAKINDTVEIINAYEFFLAKKEKEALELKITHESRISEKEDKKDRTKI